jgi:hypothetical protein
MIFWRGYGILSVVILAAAAVIGANISPQASVLLLIAGAVVNGAIGYLLNKSLRAAGAARDRLHTLFGIPMEYWSLAILAYAAFGYFVIMK